MFWGEYLGLFVVLYFWWFVVDLLFVRKGIGFKLLYLVEEEIIKNMFKLLGVFLGIVKEYFWLVEMYEWKGYV